MSHVPTLELDWHALSPERDALGESPFWHPTEQRLYWVDIPGQAVLRQDPVTGWRERWDLPSEPGCIAPARAGGLVIALRDGMYRARDWGGPLHCLVRFTHDPRTTRFNDGKCDPLGRFWGGTMYEPRDRCQGELYSLDARGGRRPEVQLQALNNVVSNGLAWSPDGRTLYWAHTAAHRIDAWDWNAGANVLTRHRVFAQWPGKPDGYRADDWAGAARYGGRPDGAAVDAEGCYWSAQFEGGRLLRLAPSGECLAQLPLPARCPTMPCFGGPDGRTLYVTTASKGRPEGELAHWPENGRVLVARVEVPGLPVNFFEEM
ncbi:SMP-30/gluconolactonase/LRE family protein [Curvibacter sp. HBC61]|uniref:SMP-30/gluconolactonase/LRE family protein n=1 Tax=Curvibacter cyanobacteriorum TaxID=3026422 RepID=A0ABT5N460_9BURK|nr:SMP-30/gluconolactonase/LRE family protein [Curvibacter sp. HBC61]MDD0840339.1 SMP-30/gluconolactonase/LRE family protein [Curvibacter sp. HBC61]